MPLPFPSLLIFLPFPSLFPDNQLGVCGSTVHELDPSGVWSEAPS